MDLEKFVLDDIANVEKEMKDVLSCEPKQVYEMLNEYIFQGGKRIRPMLFMLCFRTMNGIDEKSATKIAALIELFHNFTLIHDDIEDDSKFRRGKPTLHVSYGIPIALNSGDALYTVVWNKLLALDIPLGEKIKISSMLGNAFRRTVEGQGIELEWLKNKKINVSETDYLNMVSRKTGALIGVSCEIGAFLADMKKYTEFREFGEALGMAFQIQDDVLNIVGDFEKYKKDICGDITEGKRTLIVIHTMAHANNEEKKMLEQILLSHTTNKKKIDYAVLLFKKYKSIDYARSKAMEFAEKARTFLLELHPSKEKCELEKLVNFVINRES